MDKTIYMDYAATTPVDPRVAQVMSVCLTQTGVFGNPASAHVLGQSALDMVEAARNEVAQLLRVSSNEIVWTSGATESNNLAIQGVTHYYKNKGRHIVTCRTEHKAVLDTCKQMQREGFEVTYLNPDATGCLDPSRVEEVLRPDTVLVSLMHVNNEIGVIQDVETIGTICRQQGVLFHVDAAQSVGKLSLDLGRAPIDLLSFSAHKVYGPKGIGGLYVSAQPKVCLEPIIYGGGHEMGYRPGTLATHQIVGIGAAFRLAAEEMHQDNHRLADLKRKLWEGLKVLPGISANGKQDQSVAGILNVSFAGIEGEGLLYALRGLAVSTGSACTSATQEASYVLRALGLNDQLAQGSIRFSLGRFSTHTEVERATEMVISQVQRLRDLAPNSMV